MPGVPPPSEFVRQAAARFSMPLDEVAALEAAIRPDYPGDEMMIELRLLRALSSVREGAVSIPQAIEEFRRDRSAA